MRFEPWAPDEPDYPDIECGILFKPPDIAETYEIDEALFFILFIGANYTEDLYLGSSIKFFRFASLFLFVFEFESLYKVLLLSCLTGW